MHRKVQGHKGELGANEGDESACDMKVPTPRIIPEAEPLTEQPPEPDCTDYPLESEYSDSS